MIILGSPFGILSSNTFLGAALQVTPWNLGFTALLAIVVLIGTSGWKTIVNLRSLRFFGEISYGLYFIHMFIFGMYDRLIPRMWPTIAPSNSGYWTVALRFILCGATAVGIAFLSRRYYEEYFLRLKDRFTRSPLVLLAAPSPSRDASAIAAGEAGQGNLADLQVHGAPSVLSPDLLGR